MNDEKLQNKFLEVLDDEDIVDKITKNFFKSLKSPDNLKKLKQILNLSESKEESNKNQESDKKSLSAEISEKTETINKLNTELLNLERKNKSLNNEIVSLRDELKVINEQSENKLKEIKLELDRKTEETNRFRKMFLNMEEIYNVYNSLDILTKIPLKGIFKGNTIEDFIFCGAQREVIESLWEFIKTESLSGKNIVNLDKIFTYFFELHNKTYDEPVFERLNTAVGENFDEDKNIRHPSGNVTGNISEVIFEGYKNTVKEVVVKKSVVKI